jgi:hypothetical protein
MWNRRIETRSIPRTIRNGVGLRITRRVNPHAFRHSAAVAMLEKRRRSPSDSTFAWTLGYFDDPNLHFSRYQEVEDGARGEPSVLETIYRITKIPV